MCALGALMACGGSSSETPWPAEPIDLEPGPAGEGRQRGNVIDTTKLPDNYTKRGGAGGAGGSAEAPSADGGSALTPSEDPELEE